MLHRVRFLFAFASLCVSLALASDAALAQTTSSSGGTTGGGSENISSPIPNPNRFLLQNGQYVDVTNSPRPQNLNPTGVNFSDCEQDLKLSFPLVVSGFNGGSGIEVWAGTTDCTQATARAVGGIPTCWRLSPPATQLLDPTTTSISYDVYARDVMRYLGTTPPQSPSYDPSWHNGPNGESACHEQATDAAVTVNVFFIPVEVTARVGMATGTAYQYALNTDTVAPPPPTVSNIGFGDTLLTVNWTSPGNDPDIAGFAVWADPPAGGTSSGGGCSCGSTPGGGGANSYVGGDAAGTQTPLDASELVCSADATVNDGAIPLDATADVAQDAITDVVEEPIDASMPDGAADAAADAQADGGAPPGGDAGAADAGGGGLPPGCHYVNVGAGGACNSYNLTGHTFLAGSSSSSGGTIDSGIGTGLTDGSTTGASASAALSVENLTGDGAITGDDGGGGAALAGGGISEIPPQYKAGEVDDRTATQMTLTGLSNGVTYTVVVTSIDGSGNVGPPSTPQCEQPQPVNDFWATYKQNGGGASGCALEGTGGATELSVFGGALVGLAALVHRRRRRRW